MKYISGLLFLIVMSYLAWPYVHVYQLDKAINAQDQAALTRLIDLTAVRKTYKENLAWRTQRYTTSDHLASGLIRQGVDVLGHMAVDTVVDIPWIIEQLQHVEGSLWTQVSFAFFESPIRFTIRVGELGHAPAHVQMTLQDWVWRVTAIYL